MTKAHALTVKISPKLRARVKALAADLGVSTSELVRETLKQRLAQSKRRRSMIWRLSRRR